MGKRKCFLCSAKPPAVSLHSFPKNVEESRMWKQICGFRENDDVSRCFICSNHFIPDDYLEPNAKVLGGNLRLKPSRFPSEKVPFPVNNVSKQQQVPPTSIIYVPPIQSNDAGSICIELPASTVSLPANKPETHYSEAPRDTPEPSTSKMVVSPTQIDETILHTPKKRKFFEPRFVSEITSPDLRSPRKAKRALQLVKDKLKKEKLKKHALAERNRRLKKKVTTLQDIINHLKKRSSLSEDAADTILNIVPVRVQEIIKRRLTNKKKAKFSPELRTFALSLQFYSSKAYEYVRKTWDNLLPHPSTIRAWYTKVGGSPGFSSEALQAISDQETKQHHILNIVIDEMSIREQMIFENGRFYGGVDLGTEGENTSDNLPAARLALVFMAVAINGSWKIPIGYFFYVYGCDSRSEG